MLHAVVDRTTPLKKDDSSPVPFQSKEVEYSAQELAGIREMLNNPKPASPRLVRALEKYQQHVVDNPGSGW